MYYLPIFLQKNRLKEALEVFKGISLRFLQGNFDEQSRVILLLFQIDDTRTGPEVIAELKENFNSHLGIILSDSDFISRIGVINDFILFAPTAGRKFDKENIFQIFLSEWEAGATKNLNDWGIDKEDVLLVSPFDTLSPALKPFEEWNKVTVNKPSELTKKTKTQLTNYENYVIIGATKQWPIIKMLKTAMKDDIKHKQIITTSSFEDWRIPAPRRKSLAEGVMYTYPTISDKGKKAIESFQKEFFYKPSIYHLLAYDVTDICIKTLLKAGPNYASIRKYLTKFDEFETVVTAKTGFSDNGRPYIIGKSPEDIFQIKYVDKDGKYALLNKEV